MFCVQITHICYMIIIKAVLHFANTHTTNSLKFYSTFRILLTHPHSSTLPAI